jgi:hypothetical protein
MTRSEHGASPPRSSSTTSGGIKAKRINVRLNTPGGEVFDGTAIYNALKSTPPASSFTLTELQLPPGASSPCPAMKCAWRTTPT